MLAKESYLEQTKRWPQTGQHILAQFDHDGVVVYQAYRPAIGHFAAHNQYFGGEFKLSRMSWIKPNFLWMMYRCGWGVKPDQEVVLAITLKRFAFDLILAKAVHSSYQADIYGTYEQWQEHVAESEVRLQWDPDHDPFGAKEQRRAIQLGMSGDVLKAFSKEWIIKIEDISLFVAEQRRNLDRSNLAKLRTPREEIYPMDNSETAQRLGLTALEDATTRKS